MSSKRSKDQIIAQILVLCQGDGTNKTRIGQQANLNINTLNSNLDLLLEKGFLETIQGGRTIYRTIYRTTPAGERALETLRSAEEVYS